MKKIVMCVWNDFDNDDRIQKKATTLSKKYYVVVKSVCKQPKPNKIKLVNDNLRVEYYWFDNSKFFWFWNRLINNKKFWRDKIELAHLYDCNDPDTLNAGVLAKKRYDSKIVYDSHELWQGTRRLEADISYTLYAYIGNSIQYWREKKLVKNATAITTVSEYIADELWAKYSIPVCVIPNFSYSNPHRKLLSEHKQQNKTAVFFGAKIRLGVKSAFDYLTKIGWNCIFIGGSKPLTDKNIKQTGFLDRNNYQKELANCDVGILDFRVTCDNIKYCMPNKLYEYIQAGLPIITNNELLSVAKFVRKNNIGIILNNNKSNQYLLQELENNLQKYKKNIYNISQKYTWENQEQKILKYYDLVLDL